MRAYFVTGTDTGVGKTSLARALLAAASARGLRTGCMKPVESGCARTEQGEMAPLDARILLEATNMGQRLESVCPYAYEAPVAPGVAAEAAGQAIDFARIARCFAELCEGRPDLAVVEGAGGLLVPLGEGRVIADLVLYLGLPLIIVGRPGLGTINHTLLTIEAASRRAIPVTGFAFSSGSQPVDHSAVSSNVAEIVRMSGVRYLGQLPWLQAFTGHVLVQAAEDNLDLDCLLE